MSNFDPDYYRSFELKHFVLRGQPILRTFEAYFHLLLPLPTCHFLLQLHTNMSVLLMSLSHVYR